MNKFTSASESERDAIIRDVLATIPKIPNIKEEGIRVVITGKGGVGKTVITSLLAYYFTALGKKVLAVDEDPQMNFPYTLGLDPKIIEKIFPLNKQLDYIEEKTGARPGTGWGLFIKLNPEVEDVVSRFGIKINNRMSLLVMGTVVQAAVGCVCPENDLLEAVMNYIALKRNEIILMDTEAGLEHFGRAISKGFHYSIVVSEPSYNSLMVAFQAAKLAQDLKIPNIHLLINKLRTDSEKQKVLDFIENQQNKPFKTLNFLPYEPRIYEYEPSVLPLFKKADSNFLTSFSRFFEEVFEQILNF